MTSKQMIMLACALCLSSAQAVAQSNNGPTPASSPATKSKSDTKTVNVLKHAIVIPPEKAKPIRVPRFDKAPVIDGKLDDEVWKQAASLKDFYQINPGDNTTPSKPTEAFIGYDSRFLYFAFHCYDDPSKVRGTVAK